MLCVSLRSLTGQVYETCNGFKATSCRLLLDAIHRFLAVSRGHVLPFQIPHFQLYGILEIFYMAVSTQYWQGLVASLWHPVASPTLPFPGPVVRCQPWDPTPNTHTLMGRWEQAQVGLFLFWLSPDTGWTFSLGNWWQRQRKPSFLLCNISNKVSPSVERLCEICTNGVWEGKASQQSCQQCTGPLNLGAESSALCDERKVRGFFYENDLLYSDLLTWVKANLNMISIYCIIRKTESRYYTDFFNEIYASIESVSALEKLHILWKLPSRNDGSVVLC